MVCPVRVERTTFGSANQRSIHLSYGHVLYGYIFPKARGNLAYFVVVGKELADELCLRCGSLFFRVFWLLPARERVRELLGRIGAFLCGFFR